MMCQRAKEGRDDKVPNMKGEMKMRSEIRFLAIFMILTFMIMIPTSHAQTATISTDKADYSPEETVTIYGSNFNPEAAVSITVTRPDGSTNQWTVTSDESGSFIASYLLDGIEGVYTVDATDGTNAASITFTDKTAPGSLAAPSGSLPYTGPAFNPTHWAVQIGDTIHGTISGATDLEDETTTTVFIKSSYFGNTEVTGTVSDSTITFQWTVPSSGVCQTTVVAYESEGNNANNALITEGGKAAAGFAIVGADGKLIETCEVVPPQPPPPTVEKTANPSFTRTYKWEISKSVAPTEAKIPEGGSATFNYVVSVTHDEGTDSDWKVTGIITVTNPADEAIIVDVTDEVDNGGTCSIDGGGSGVIVAAHGSAYLGYTCTYPPSGPSSSSGINSAMVTWDENSVLGTAAFDFGAVDPEIVNGHVTVEDSLGGLLGMVSYDDPSPTKFEYPYTFTGDPGGTCTTHDNTVSLVETGQTADATVEVCVGKDLTVEKTATPSFKRTYNWDISKSVTPTLVEQIGGTATFNYAVVVEQTGFTDSDWQVTGTITVTNPNDWEDIIVDVTDAVDNGGTGVTCTVGDGAGVTVPMSWHVDLYYTCTYSSAPSPSNGINTATATWDKDKFFTPDGSAQGTAKFAFTYPTTTVNKDVTVTDTFDGATTTLGTLTATDEEPYASATYTYSHTVNVPTWNCVFYTNTATIAETGTGTTIDEASTTVEVCGPAKTGALTMGFWQNKNGQGIITGGASTGGVCNSGTWLRQYAPFQDLSATAACSQVATYVYNVVKAASASGPSMNAMLKAQMLATALDVYFSDPALGGNKINAPAPIGGVSIDLTKICKNPLTCSTFEDVSAAFGGATRLTVSQMLAYAAGQSNVGGSMWYGNVKAMQELAKDAFDAINNQRAFSP